MPTNEIQAAKYQKAPIALVPLGDPFTQNPPGTTNLTLVNLYRAGVNQPQALNNTAANTTTYCTNLRSVGAQKLNTDKNIFTAAASPLPAVGTNLFTTLAHRMWGSYEMLNCRALTGQANPITLTPADPATTTSAVIKPGSSSVQ